jgi:hypothetical protein
MGAFHRLCPFRCRLQRYDPRRVRLRIFTNGCWRRLSRVSDGDANSNASARGNTGSDARAGCGEHQLCKCAAYGPTWPVDDASCEDSAEYRLLDTGRVQVGALYGSGSGSENVRRGRQPFLDMDRRKPHDAWSVADLCDLRLGWRPDLNQRHLDVGAAGAK